MKKITTLFRESVDEMRSVQNLSLLALIGALSVVTSYFSIQVGDFLKIGFTTVVQQIAYYLFGPGTGMLFAAAMDLLKYAIRPVGGFFPGYTLSAMTAAVLYGFFYYRQKITFRRVLLAQFVVAVICNICMSTLWWWMTTTKADKAFMQVFMIRAVKNLVQLPVNSLLYYGVWECMERTGILRQMKRKLFTGRV